MIKAVIFDMDGLIIDTEHLQSESFEIVLKEYGIKPVLQKNGLIQTIGIRADENWEIIKKKYKLNIDTKILVKKKQVIYEELLKKNIQAMPGLFTVLKLIKKEHLKMAIASSSAMDHIEIVVNKLKIKSYFDALVSGHELEKSKPSPEIFLKAAERLHINPEYCMVLEDAEAGVLAGKSAGMVVIAVPNIYTKIHDFLKADLVVNSLEDINEKVIRSF